MYGVILAGGNGTRLKPLTEVTNKHLLPIYNKPMIYYPLELLINLGVTNIILVTGKEYAGSFADLLGDGSRFGVNITYKVQEGALGIAHALGLTENVVRDEPVTVILGDNVFAVNPDEMGKIRALVKDFGIKRALHQDILGGTARENATIIENVLAGEKGDMLHVTTSSASHDR